MKPSAFHVYGLGPAGKTDHDVVVGVIHPELLVPFVDMSKVVSELANTDQIAFVHFE